MPCSPEQLAANRRNSKLSQGPSPEARFVAFEGDLKRANDVARFLARRAAMLSVRLDRSAREEAARITLNMLEAHEVEEDIRASKFEELIAKFADHPAESARKLHRAEEGFVPKRPRLATNWVGFVE